MKQSGLAKDAIHRRITRIARQLAKLKAENDDHSLDSFDSRYRRLMDEAMDDAASYQSGQNKRGPSSVGDGSNGPPRWAFEDASSLSPSQEAAYRRQEEVLRLEEELRATEAAYQLELKRLTTLNLTALRDSSRDAQRLNDDTLLDGAEAVLSLGRADPRQTHNLFLRSAYEAYSSGGEPLFTQSQPAADGFPSGVACTDFIFYSGLSMYAEQVMSLPHLNQLRGDNPQSLLSRPDPYWREPPPLLRGLYNKHLLYRQLTANVPTPAPGSTNTTNANITAPPSRGDDQRPPSKQQVADAKRQLETVLAKSFAAAGIKDKVGPQRGLPDKKETEKSDRDSFWGGIWLPNPCYNPLRSHCWLPNDTFVSSHLALVCELQFIEGQVATTWK
jgi:hypothetical protein